MQKYTVSLCMIVKNEEKHLDRCLNSVKNKVDEIVIVDTGSTDGTIEIANKHNAKVYHFNWNDDFAAARNFSINQSSSDYILILDADEYLDEGADLQKDLMSAKDYYIVKFKNYLSDGNATYHHNVRLFKNKIGLFYYGKLHEHLNITDPNYSFSEGTATFLIHHLGYMWDTYVEKDKKNRNTRIMEKEVEANPTHYSYFNLGKIHFSNGNYLEALEAFKKSNRLSNYNSNTKELVIYTVRCLQALGKFEDAINLLEESINTFPKYTDFYYELGRTYEKLGYLRDAELLYKKCLELGDANDYTSTIGLGGYLGLYSLSRLYSKRKMHADAFETAFRAIQDKKHYRPALIIYLQTMLKTNISLKDTLEHISKVYPVETISDLEAIVSSLYEIRHPLLNYYFSQGKGKVRTDLRAVSLQYAKFYEDAFNEWNKVEMIPLDNAYDVILLAFLLQSEMLLNKSRGIINLSEKDWKVLKQIVLREEIKKAVIPIEVEKILLKLCPHIIVLEEYDHFQYISSILMKGSIEVQIELADILDDYGFSDNALELLFVCIEKSPKDTKIYELIGDIYFRKHKYHEALTYYEKSLNTKSNFPIYEKIYNVCESQGNQKSMEGLKEKMKDAFPLSRWVKA